jgi:hypothetical protein
MWYDLLFLSAIAVFLWIVSHMLTEKRFFRCGVVAMSLVGLIALTTNSLQGTAPTVGLGAILLVGGIFVEELARLLGLMTAYKIVSNSNQSEVSGNNIFDLIPAFWFGVGFGVVELLAKVPIYRDVMGGLSSEQVIGLVRFTGNLGAAFFFHILASVCMRHMIRHNGLPVALASCIILHALYNLSVILIWNATQLEMAIWSMVRLFVLMVAALMVYQRLAYNIKN